MSQLFGDLPHERQFAPLATQAHPLGPAMMKKQRKKDERRLKYPGFEGELGRMAGTKKSRREAAKREKEKKRKAGGKYGSLVGERYKGG